MTRTLLAHKRARRGTGRRNVLAEPLEGRLLLSKTVYVDVSSPAPATNGPTWATAYKDLQLALGVAVSGDTIRVADGTYKPTATTTRTISFALKTGVGVYGGYAGYGAADPNARDVTANPTILSGDIGTAGSNTDNSYHVVVASSTDSTAVLDGLTVSGGNANGGAAYSQGGGMYNSSGRPRLANCTFSGNTAELGGGVYNSSGSPTLVNCTFSGNSASARGGGINNASSSSPVLTNCIFIGNSAYNIPGTGGGMNNSSSNPTLTNCTFDGNSASTSGGAVYNNSSNPTLANCIIWNSSSGPIYNNLSTPIITCSDVQGGYTGIGNINADPLFVRSPWTGSDGLSGTSDDDLGDLRLRVGSPVLDIGSNAAIPAGVSTDLGGNARIQNGTVDLGAYEGVVSAPAPRTIYVDLNAVGANTGSSWTHAFTGLQPALLAAVDGDTIRIADGTYKPTSTSDRTISFVLKAGVGIYGGYAGYGAADPDARDVAANPSILSGDIGTVGSNTDNSYHVVVGTATDNTAVLDGFTITAGYANGGSRNSYGGGMYSASGSPTLANCTFTGNTALLYGGGMYNTFSSPRLVNCVFTGNSGPYGGGMGNVWSSSPILTNCSFNGNGPSTSGGGVYNYNQSSPALTNCTFSGNSARFGGGVYDFTSSPTLTNCTFTGNTATGADASGGGVCNANSSSPTLTDCMFSGNSAVLNGAGMYNGNSSTPTLTNCAFAGNTAGSSGGGMYNASSPTLTNCIIWGNTAPSDTQVYGSTTITYSDIQGGGFTGTGNIDADPLFVRNPSGSDYGDLRLQSTSPCIDAGSNAAVPAGITTDLAGNARIIDYPGLRGPGAIVDMGAYERQLPIVVNSGADAAINEASGITRSGSFADTDITDITFTATVNYGDGSGTQTLSLNPDKTFALSHTYRDNGLFTVTVTVTGNHNSGTGTFALTVNNVSPTVTLPASTRTNVATPLAASGSFTDPGTLDTFTATVNYGDGSGTQPLTLKADKTFNLSHSYTAPGRYSLTVRVTDKDGGIGTATTIVGVTGVVARSVFYNNSFYDGNNPAANPADDGAIATDKSALLPGQTASFANYTSFSRGINGIIIDVAALAAASLTPADFVFRAGTSASPGSWPTAPAPSSILVRPGAGINGSDRIEVIWADNAIQKTWLQTTLLADANTGLAAADVFYFGNAVGDTGNSPIDAAVTSADILAARSHPAAGPVPITSAWDFNRDGAVNSADTLIAQRNQTIGAAALPLLATPSAPLAAVVAAPVSTKTIPLQPRNLFSTVQTNGSILLTWRDNSSNEDGFLIQISRDGKAWSTFASTAAGAGWSGLMSYTVSGLPSGTWQFRVLACNSAGLSLPTNVRTAVV